MNSVLGRLLFGRSRFTLLVLVLLLSYLALNLFALLVADRIIFQPPPASYRDTADIIKLTTRNNTQISAVYLPDPNAIYTVLYSHGNGSDLGTSRPVLETIQRIGFSVFAYDYQGYGTSQGTPSELNTYQDIDAAYAYLTTVLSIPANRIILYGFSVGSGPSIDLAVRQPVAGMILEGVFTSAFRVVTYFPILLFDRFNNISKIKSINYPLLFIHGTADRIIPYHQGKTLYEHANQPKQFLTIPGADHNNLIAIAGTRYEQALRDFAQKIEP